MGSTSRTERSRRCITQWSEKNIISCMIFFVGYEVTTVAFASVDGCTWKALNKYSLCFNIKVIIQTNCGLKVNFRTFSMKLRALHSSH